MCVCLSFSGYDYKVKNPEFVSDGFCNGGDYMSDACSNDGGDCEGCIAHDPDLIGDGHCDLNYNTTFCSWDGGDCLQGSGDGDSDCKGDDKRRDKG